MGDGVYTLSTSLLQSLLAKERVAARAARRFTLPEYSADPNCVTSARRDREARWICAIGRRLGLGFNTVSVAITVFDRVLDTVVVQSKYVNCLALTCLYLAVKLHEECFAAPCQADDSGDDLMDWDHPQLKLFRAAAAATAEPQLLNPGDFEDEEFYLWRDASNSNTDEARNKSCYIDASNFLARVRVDYTPRELTRMESRILRLLDWDLLARPTFAQFLEAMLAVAGAPHLAASPTLRANFEAITTRWALIRAFSASTLALALLSLMFERTFGASLAQCVTQALADVFKIDANPLAECRAQVEDALRGYHTHAQFLQRTLAARSHSASPFSGASTARASPALPPPSSAMGPSAVPPKVLPGSTVDGVDAEIVEVLYNILENTQP